MTTIRKILVATDFSPFANAAVERAAQLAQTNQAELYILHIASLPALDALLDLFGMGRNDIREQILSGCREKLASLADEIGQRCGIPVATEVREGLIATALIQAAHTTSVDLIVLGARGESRTREMLIGTTANRIVGKTPLPVLIVRRQSQIPYRHVLVPVDFSGYTLPALRLAQQIVVSGEITLFHAFELPFESRLRHAGVEESILNEYLIQTRRQAARQIDQIIEEDIGATDRWLITQQIMHGPVSQLVTEQANLSGVDVVVMGRRGRSLIEEWLLGTVGSVTHHVLSEVGCDVLVSGPSPE